LDFRFLNSIVPRLISVSRINKFNCLPPGSSYGKRVVEHYELDFITWGEGFIITDGQRIPAKKGSLFFRKPGTVVEGLPPYYCFYVVFDLLEYSNVPIEFPGVTIIEDTAYIEDLFSRLFNEFIEQRSICEFATRTYLMQIMLYIHTQWESTNRFESSGRSLRLNYKNILNVKEFIDKNPGMHFSLDMLASGAGYSRYFFCRLFKEVVGESPISYVNISRINHAKRMLLETDKSVKEIMTECGFENESHFFKLFKRHVGMSPLLFREKNKPWKQFGAESYKGGGDNFAQSERNI